MTGFGLTYLLTFIMLHILIPIDFSDSSTVAISYAAQMTKAMHGNLILLHVVEPIGGDATMFIDDRMIQDDIDEAHKKLASIKSELPDIDPTLIKTIVHTGFPLEKILSTIKEENISLVVMGTTGTSNKFQDVLGSNTYHVVRKANCAVMTIPVDSKTFDIKKIAFAVDLHKKENLYLLQIVKHIARHFHAEINFIHVSKNKEISLTSDIHSEAVLWLAEQLKEFKCNYVNLTGKNIADVINNYAINTNTDLLVLSPEKHDLLSTLFGESTTRALVLHSHVPLLTLPADY